ncbi:MAG: tetratricopeptide repeat protein [Chthoniobacteraceae bacterium]
MLRPPRPLSTAALVAVLLVSAVIAGAILKYRIAQDHAVAAALADALSAPRMIFDGRTLEARFDAVVDEIAATRHQRPEQIRDALERFAAGGMFGNERGGYDTVLAQLATRRFETAIGSARDLANSQRSELPAWRMLTLAAVLELGRGRAVAAEPLLAQAFELANRSEQLDTPAAASLLSAYGAMQLLRSQPAEAEPFLRRATSILTKAPGPDKRDRERVLAHFAQSISAQGYPEEAAALR